MFRSTAENHIRLMVIGEGRVGKSALIVKYLTGRFIWEYQSETDKRYPYQTDIDGCHVHMEIVDSLTMNDKDIRWAEGFMLVYDITNEESVDQMEHLKKKIESIRSSRSFCMVVVGNKTDLEHCREVRREKAEHIVSRLSAAYHVDCSACGPAIQVRNAFDELCRQVALLRQQSAQKRERRRSSLSQVGRGLKMLVQTGKSKSHGPASSGSENGTTSPVGSVRQSSNSGNKKGGKFGTSSSYTSLVSAPILNGLPEENPFFPSVETDDVIRRSHKRQNSETRIDFGKRASAHNINKTMYGAMVS